MKTLKFKCTLLSDVILNQKAASEGPNKTLDFIPGNCFLGITAAQYKKFEERDNAIEVFHSGRVRFGDAHPSKNGVRGLKIPASMFYPKLKKASELLYIHHIIPKLEDVELKKLQLKQSRDGFYVFKGDTATKVKTDTNFAIKSAYDKKQRRSEDNKMYGYESLQKGLEMFFEVQVVDERLAVEIKEALVGTKRVGRSRTAQYGLVKIEYLDKGYDEIESSQEYAVLKDKGGKETKCVTVYADSRLIFLDDCGFPTFRPNAKDLGIENGEILWDKSQVRTFQYSPWNFIRQCFDEDRCGIEKGSVFVVAITRCGQLPTFTSDYIGSYKNEGFGKVIYNPLFLKADNSGKALIKIVDNQNCVPNETNENAKRDEMIKKEIETLSKGSTLLRYLAERKRQQNKDYDIYAKVNNWVSVNGIFFIGKEKFASQWSSIRGLAMAVNENVKIKESIDTYISHGIKSNDWEGARKNKLMEFMNSCDINDLRIGIVNLAAEMAKKCRKEGEK